MSGTGKSDEELRGIAREVAGRLITGFPNKSHRKAYLLNYEIILSALRDVKLNLPALREARQHKESRSVKECNTDAK